MKNYNFQLKISIFLLTIILSLLIITNSFAQLSNLGLSDSSNTSKWKPYHISSHINNISTIDNKILQSKYESIKEGNHYIAKKYENSVIRKSVGTSQPKVAWQKVEGPFGGNVRKFYNINNIIYAITDRNIYQFINDKWVSLNFDEEACNIILCMYIYPTGRILVGTDYGMYYSDDAGNSWNKLSLYYTITAINDILQIQNGDLLLSTNDGIYKSTMGQFTFSYLTMRNMQVGTVCIDSSGNIWAGTNNGLYKARYSDLIWTRMNIDTNYYGRIVIDPKGVIYTFSSNNLYRSSNSGQSWDYLSGAYISDIIQDTLGELIVTRFNQIQKVNDQGIVWSSPQTNLFLLCTFLTNNNNYLVGSLGDGALIYNMDQNSFNYFSNGMSSSTIRCILPMKNGELLVATDADSLYISNNNGATWTPTYNYWTRYMKQTNNGVVYCAANSGIIKSTDYGKTWQPLSIDVSPYFINSFDVSDDNMTICAGSSTGGVYLSEDGGNIFQKIMTDNNYFVDAVKIIDKKTFLISSDSLYYTHDAGLNINSIKDNRIFGVSDIMIDNNKYIYISGLGGLLRSLDGKKWTLIGPSYLGYSFLALDSNNNLIVASRSGEMVNESTDQGDNWQVVADPLINTYSWSFALSPDGYIYNGTQDKGLYIAKIYIEKNNLTNFTPLIQNFPNPLNTITRIDYEVPYSSPITLSVYDILGRKLETLVSGTSAAGHYYCYWNASKYSSGIYFYMIKLNNYTQTKKMILIK